MVSHELRTPLTSVLGFAKIIKKRLESVVFPHAIAGSDADEHKVVRAISQIESNIDIVISEGERLAALINNVLDLAKIESGRVEWHLERVSVPAILERAVTIMGPLISKPLTLDVKVEPGLPRVVGDQDRLTQVVVNLISNSVIDTGIGIAPDDQTRVFEQFVQAGDILTDRPNIFTLPVTSR